jgi:hypothetical protein
MEYPPPLFETQGAHPSVRPLQFYLQFGFDETCLCFFFFFFFFFFAFAPPFTRQPHPARAEMISDSVRVCALESRRLAVMTCVGKIRGGILVTKKREREGEKKMQGFGFPPPTVQFLVASFLKTKCTVLQIVGVEHMDSNTVLDSMPFIFFGESFHIPLGYIS